MLLSLSVICQAEPLTKRFIVEFAQKTASPNQSFSMKRERRRLSDSPSIIADTNRYVRSDLQPDDELQRARGCGVKTTLIESMAWQSLHAMNLLMAYELILTTKDTSLSTNPYSWIP
ncbi:hypothetical protein, partial [Endozoicomonas sp. ONNA1]